MLKWITAPLDAVFRRSAHGCGRAGNEPVAASADGGDRVAAAPQLPPHPPDVYVDRAGRSAGIIEPLQEMLQFLTADRSGTILHEVAQEREFDAG